MRAKLVILGFAMSLGQAALPLATNPNTAPPAYFDSIDSEAASFHPDLVVGFCLPVQGHTQSSRPGRGEGLSPFTALNNFLASSGKQRVDIDSGTIKVLRLPAHGRVGRGAPAEGMDYKPASNYLGADRLVLGAEIGGQRFELRYYLQVIENFDVRRFTEYCPRSAWRIDAPVVRGVTTRSDAALATCSFVFTKSASSEPVRIGISAPLAVMALFQAHGHPWNDQLWAVTVTKPPANGRLVLDAGLEASYLFTPNNGFVGLERIGFDVSQGERRFSVEQTLQVDALDPEYEVRVPPELRECPPFNLPGLAREGGDLGD